MKDSQRGQYGHLQRALWGTLKLGTVAECTETEHGVATTAEGEREVAGEGKCVAMTDGFGASQVSVGTCAAVAALPTVVVWRIGPGWGGVAEMTMGGRRVEGTGGCEGAGTAALCMAAISTLPTGV